ncbi:hypothetical protein KC19_9G111300 [Ceratodon purpureus]|uniref:Uncharacterized protein n=1 Tax=Ceratodon purpureus TaxID=3225 RepID=A0A8T0GQX0_CERPU|nr:hypothetical protein KC19_9G111300 [Ceratodon purpureus]
MSMNLATSIQGPLISSSKLPACHKSKMIPNSNRTVRPKVMDLHHHHLDISPKIFQQLKRMLHLGSHVSHLICTSWLGLTVVFSISCCEYGSPFNCITTRRKKELDLPIYSVRSRLW